jgi:NodT family efflux transporter outer membrane factor (OMF) lipoprotein
MMPFNPLFVLVSDRIAATVGRPGLASLLAGVLLALGGCAAVSPPGSVSSGVGVPPAWSDTDLGLLPADRPLAQWWLRFDDPLLSTLVAQALQTNTSVVSAHAALRQARALRDVSAAGLGPTFGGSASVQRSQSGENSASNSFRAGLDASWEIDVFGAQRSALHSSEAGAQASAATLGDVQVSIAAEVALSYIALRAAQARLRIAQDNLVSQQETLQLTQWRLQAGLVSSLESEQAIGATEQTLAQLPALQTSIEQSSHALAVLTGQAPASLATRLTTPVAVPQAPLDLTLGIPTETLRQRPDVRAAEYQVQAAMGRVAQADAARLPSFKLSGSLGLSALTLGALTNGASLASAVVAGVSVPLFDGGAARAQVRAQQAALDQSMSAYKAVVLTALKEVEDALVALRGDRERLLRLQHASDAASNAALMARQRYDSGLIDFQTVLSTQRSQLSSQDGVATARAEVSADHVRLVKALGGGWHPDNPHHLDVPTSAR